MSFEFTSLEQRWKDALNVLHFEYATPVQASAIPALLAGGDGVGIAPTGSGKTLAYGLGLLQPLHHVPLAGSGPVVHALVVVPTRELAQQVSHSLVDLIKAVRAQGPTPLRVATAVGGASINAQRLGLRGGASVLVATPGRLLELLDDQSIDLSQLRQVVLDEADRLLDSGFSDELQRIRGLLAQAPQHPQTWLFSATWNDEVEQLSQQWLVTPTRVELTHGLVPTPPITQRALAVDERRRGALLLQLVTSKQWKQALVFVGTQYTAEHVADKLYNNFKGQKVYATAFHGGLSQAQRTARLAEFKAGQWDVLVTTDLAARGIDIAGLPVVFNYDLPRGAADYTHRIGRTGRAGVAGQAISFVTPASAAHFALIQKRCNVAVAVEVVPGFETTDQLPTVSAPDTNATGGLDPNGGIKGRRLSKKDKLRAQLGGNF